MRRVDVAGLASVCPRRDNPGLRIARQSLLPMPKVAAPIKTPLGHDEWRSRALGLGQRHRTMLFLVDGKRPLSEVLSLALQAGARTSHFEDLVRLGLVELDIDSEWPADAAPSRSGGFDSGGLSTRAGVLSVEIASRLSSTTAAGALDSAAVPLSAQSDVHESVSPTAAPQAAPAVDPAPSSVPASAPAPTAALTPITTPKPPPVPRVAASREVASSPDLSGRRGDGSPAASPSVAQPTVSRAALAAARRPAPPMNPKPAGRASAEAIDSGPGTLTLSRERPAASSEELVSRVRDLLLDTLRADAPLFAAITVVRVRRAQTRKELIDVVWAIERHLGISRRKRREMPTLQEARDLLGMGNTQISLDTQSFPDTE